MGKAGKYFLGAGLLLLFVLASWMKVPDNPPVSLPRSTPEAEGVSSVGILAFLDSVAGSKHEFHSIMILRHGKVVAEGWWAPYAPDIPQALYSTSKSFTSTAVGFAVAEGLLRLDDKVVSFFPKEVPDSISPFLAALTVRDLLTMSVGMDPDPTFFNRINPDTNWIRQFLAVPVVNKPGTKFLYNSMATYTLSAIVQKVTGKKVLDYLTPRLFQPLNISGIYWEEDNRGINTGGWGLRLRTEDMAKFGQLLLQKGNWYGKQIIPGSWVEEATTAKIDQAPGVSAELRKTDEWKQGYCYQFWRCTHNAFRADGAFGQYIFIIPDKDAVIAIQSESQDMGGEMRMIWNTLYPAFKDTKLHKDKAAQAKLKSRLASGALPLPPKGTTSPVVAQISGKTYALETNSKGYSSLSFHFDQDLCRVEITSPGKVYDFSLGSGTWVAGMTTMPGPNLLPSSQVKAEKVLGCYGWKDEKTLVLTIRYIESPHTLTLICRFEGDKLTVSSVISNTPNAAQPVIQGVMKP
jgi:CubicO group peptidase (beta-lactamase class C family)